MHVQWRDFAGGREAFPFVKWGCDSITMEFIHPHSRPRGEGAIEARIDGGRASVDDEKNLFFPSSVPFLSLFPSIRRCIVIKEARGGLAWSFDIVEGFFQDGQAEGNFPRGRPISSRLI